jgi:hypothetical protein
MTTAMHPAAPSANGPQRQPDGSVFLPKPAQRQLGVRTLVTEAAELPRTVELGGKVVMDPNAGGKVQPLNAGRIEPGPRGLPNPGQAVRKGEVLAYVVPSAAPIERSNQAAQLAELRAAKALADKRVARLKELADTVPRKEIEAAESEAPAWRPHRCRRHRGLATREALLAPVSGVIASAQRRRRPGGRCARTGVRDRRPGAAAHRGAGLRCQRIAGNVGSREPGGRQPACAAHLHRRRAQPARAGAAAGLPPPKGDA